MVWKFPECCLQSQRVACKVKEFGLIILAEKYFEKPLKDPVLRFQELTRTDKAVSTQLIMQLQFVHMGQRS